MDNSTQVILTCFAGREKNMKVLMKYVDALFNMGMIHKVHLWDFTRNESDGHWLHSTYGVPVEPGFARDSNCSISTWEPVYQSTGVKLQRGGDPIQIKIKAQHNAHFALIDKDVQMQCEVCICNTSKRSIISSKGIQDVLSREGLMLCPETWTPVQVLWDTNNHITVYVEGEPFLTTQIEDGHQELEICVGAVKNTVHWDFGSHFRKQEVQHPYVTVMKVHEKRCWNEYYRHYTPESYPNHVIIKCDDDIVFIDPNMFSSFVNSAAADTTNLMRFASIINNGVTTHLQQNLGLIPRSMSQFPYDTDHGKLWGSGLLCQLLHEYFLDHASEWLKTARSLDGSKATYVHTLGHRISINFFAIHTRHLKAFQMMHLSENNDEKEITCEIPPLLNKPLCIDQSMIVSHLGFYRQRETGLNEDILLQRYAGLADEILAPFSTSRLTH